MSAPIFIVGANRSGTTLLRLVLNAHSRIGIPEELIYFDSRLAGVPIEQWRDPALPPDAYEAFVDSFLRKSCRLLDGLDAAQLKRAILGAGPFDFRRPYCRVLGAWARRHGKARWGEKTPGNLFFVDVIFEMFPEAQFIYLVRDPRAGVHSMNNTDIFSGDTAINALNRRHYTTNGLALLERTVPARQRMILRYEDFVAEPEPHCRKVCAFLGETFEPPMLRFHEKAGQFMKPRAAHTFNRAATRPIDASKIDAWKEQLSSRNVSVIESICREEMERFGYAPQGTSPNPTARFSMYAKTAYYYYQRWRHADVPQYLSVDRVFERSRRRLRRLRGRLP